MSTKTLNANQRFILLRSFFAVAIVCSLLFVCIGPLTANAAIPTQPIDYTKLDYTVRYGTYDNQVTVPISQDFFYFNVIDDGSGVNYPYVRGQNYYDFVAKPNRLYSAYVYPFSNYGISLKNVPVGARLIFDMRIDLSSAAGSEFQLPEFNRRWFYIDSANDWMTPVVSEPIESNFGEDFTVSFLIEDKPDSIAFVPSISIKRFKTLTSSDTTFTLTLRNVRLVMDIPVAYWEQWQAEQQGEMLSDIKDGIGDVNDKLDDTNDKLDELPGEIGDEMQGVIDKENEKTESSGNKFVNQILDALPDPSTEVLSSLKSLTDATAYTGTDAKLKIPALVIPAVDGLIPETEIWGGTEFSFSEYLSFLPSALLTVVQSLFTIAIVLFCVYELKGIISYCLTLNDKKGG